MNIVFEQKNSWGKIFRDPWDPRPKKKISGRAHGQPKGGQNRSVGVSNPSKTVRHPHGTWEKGGVDRPVTPPLAKVMTKTRFLAFLGVFGSFWGPTSAETM